MAIIGTFTQQPAERMDYDIEYNEWLLSGDSLLSVVAVVAPVGLEVTTLIVGTKVKVWASNGTDLTKYKITLTTTTALGRIKQDEIKLSIKDI